MTPDTPAGPDVELQRVGDQRVRAVIAGEARELAEHEVPGLVAELEPGRPRWVWDVTTRWYPALLTAGVRVERCLDLSLSRAILRSSPYVRRELVDGPESAQWDRLGPVSAHDSGLFALHEHAGFLDVPAEHARQQAGVEASEQRVQVRLLLAAESSGALAAAEMTHTGLPWRADVHGEILASLLGPRPPAGQRPAVLEKLLAQARDAFGQLQLNPDSPADLLAGLRAAGLPVSDTRAWNLERIEHPGIPVLLEYRKLQRLFQANGWRWIDTWVHDGRYRADYLPGGVVTGRWAAHGGGALSLPSQLRPAVVADDGWKLVVADVAQLEPRILAAMSGDGALASAARASDLYGGMVADGVVETRDQAKLGILGAMYGGTRGESGRMLPRLRSRYPAALDLVERAARAGERGEVVHTLLGRGSPLPTGAWTGGPAGADAEAPPEGRAWGRFTRNFVVQGTGAEWALSWLAFLRNRLWQLGSGPLDGRPQLCFFLHDEVVVHAPEPLAEQAAEAVRAAAVQAGQVLFGAFPVDFPLSISVVDRYADAK